MVCWDPPVPPPAQYILVHAAIVVSGGLAFVTYQLRTVNGIESCIIISTEVNRANINIFFLFQDPLNADILIVGTYIYI